VIGCASEGKEMGDCITHFTFYIYILVVVECAHITYYTCTHIHTNIHTQYIIHMRIEHVECGIRTIYGHILYNIL
jgi:ABC-type microcin C transport system permease subunit YejB